MKQSVRRPGELLRKHKLPIIIASVILIAGLAGLGLWLRNNYLHKAIYTASSTAGPTAASKQLKVPNNWAIGWDYDCSNTTQDKSAFVIVAKDVSGHASTTDGPIAETSKSGVGVTVMPKGGTYTVGVMSSCSWSLAVKRSSTVTTYDHETPYPQATAPAQPKVLLDISGNGNQQTQPFTTDGNWNVAYTYDCSNLGQAGNFQFDVNNTDGTTNMDTGANSLDASGGTTDYYYDSGEHYLSINSECSWHIIVKS